MRKETKIGKLICKIEDEYYFLNYFFNHNDDFKGATGTILRPVSKEEYIEITEDNAEEYLEENWRMAVQGGNTTDGLSDWVEYVKRMDGDGAFFDLSYSEYWEQLRAIGFDEEDYPVIECRGGGRCFGKETKFDKIFDKKLWKQIREIEGF